MVLRLDIEIRLVTKGEENWEVDKISKWVINGYFQEVLP